jgi:hypothetical protein
MLVYSYHYDQIGVLENNLVLVSGTNLFIPFTHRWIILDKSANMWHSN